MNRIQCGSVYISVNNTNPSNFFGGTWVQFGQGRTLVGVDTSQAEFNGVEKTGGEKTHKLTTAELASHTHTFNATTNSNGAHTHKLYRKNNGLDGGSDWNVTGSEDGTEQWITTSSGAHTHTVSGTTNTAGSGSAHNNLQPYVTVYMWKRIS